jgi:hypothetical protein
MAKTNSSGGFVWYELMTTDPKAATDVKRGRYPFSRSHTVKDQPQRTPSTQRSQFNACA